VQWVKVGPGQAEELHRVVAGRPVYVHIDCDVLEPGLALTNYLLAALEPILHRIDTERSRP